MSPSQQIKPDKKYAACPTPSGWFTNQEGDRIPAGCKSWDCPYCGPIRKKQLLDRVRDGFVPVQQDGGRVRFLTLTLSLQANNRDIMKFWARFRATLAKHGYRHFRFFWVKEFTQKGKLHLHIAIDCYVPIWLIRHAWYYATDKTSWVVFITSKINVPAGYMSKYMTKAFLQGKFRYRERRYGFSRHGFKLKKHVPDKKWQFKYESHLSPERKMEVLAEFAFWLHLQYADLMIRARQRKKVNGHFISFRYDTQATINNWQ